ncbi:hypothetical protein U8527_07075 [Kordia algicida OT-1]|uniref:Glycoside hydrolase family 19 catalytic domain-containing protein n=1 Tax=Kordia algicida OT-1 TaxID=391587 RepID=A9E9U9_9FLAO|nr:hypothetical protein [Kordia algicida]EDP94707.1 hypothetical protein KAOT1_00485 [Kordia algicida OT-1]
MKKFFTLFCFLIILSCQKDDSINQDQNQDSLARARVQIKVGNEVSKSAIEYIKLRTNNSFTVENKKNSISLSKTPFSFKSSGLGIVDTNKEIVVVNESNTKHTFKIISPLEENSVTNLIVVETENSSYEYFIKYNFIGNIPTNEETNAIDLSKFSGTIETFNSNGQQIGYISMENGSMTNSTGQFSPCPDDPTDEPSDDDSSGSDASTGIPSSNSADDNEVYNNVDSNSGGEFENLDDDCGLSWSYARCGCGGGADGHPPSGAWCCQGSPIIITDCNGNAIAQRSSNNDTKFKNSLTEPCDDGDVGVLIDKEDCDTSKEDLQKIFPDMTDDDATLLAKMINDKGADFGIDSKHKLWHFLAQAGHETGGFANLNVTESTYWTTASLLAKTYRKRFTMDSLIAVNDSTKYFAPDYLQNSSGVANIAMCCKYENGDVASGDGYKYRGRGIFQLTWKENYRKFKEFYNNKYDPDIDIVNTPSEVATNDTLAILSGMWYYKTRVLDKMTVDSTTTVYKLTKKINEARAGLKDRKKRFKKAKDSIDCVN